MKEKNVLNKKIVKTIAILLLICSLLSNIFMVTTFATSNEFVLEGSWKQEWGSEGGLFAWSNQNGRTVTFNDGHCNLWSPYDTYTVSNYTGEGFKLNITGLLGGDPGYRVEIIDNNNIEIYQSSTLVFKFSRISQAVSGEPLTKEDTSEEQSPSNDASKTETEAPTQAQEKNNIDNEITSQKVQFCNNMSVDLNWGWNLFDKNASEYDHNLAMAGLLLSKAAYDGTESIKQRLSDFKFSDYYFARYRNDPSPFEPGRSIAAKKINIGGKEKIVIAVVVRGTSNVVPDWTTNVLALVDGFDNATSEVMKDLNDSMKNIKKELGVSLTKENTLFFITGHSQGGAVAGLLSNLVRSYANQENIFTYTFASPNYDVDNNDAPSYTNVHNIINTDDFIPQCFRHWNIAGVFGEQGFKRYGNDWWYDHVDFEDTAKVVYAKTGDKDAHATETYLACLLSGLPKNMGAGATNPYNLSSIHCPVDITVFDKSGNEMGYTKGEDVTLLNSNEILIYTDGDSKYILSSSKNEYIIKFTATGDGTMTYSQASINKVSDEVLTKKTFNNVSLTKGKLMAAKIGGNIDTNDVRLFVQDEGGENIAEIGVNGKEITEVNNCITLIVIIAIVAIVFVVVLVLMIRKKNNKKKLFD